MNLDELMNIFKTLVDNGNQRAQTDMKFRNKLVKFGKTIEFVMTDMNQTFHFSISNGTIYPVTLGKANPPSMKVTTTVKTMFGIIKGNVNPMKAVVTRQVKFQNASLEDINFLNKFIETERKHIAAILN